MAQSVQVGCTTLAIDATLAACDYVMIMTSQCECEYELWSVEREVNGWLVRIHYDAEKESDTYAEQVVRCPGCGKWLVEPVRQEA